MGEFRMPALGAGMDVGRVVEWYVHPGDDVTRGQIVALVETDKANIDVEVFESGRVEQLLVEEGTKVPVGTPLAVIAPAAATAAPAEAASEPSAPEPATPAEPSAPEPATPSEPSAPALATPAEQAEAPAGPTAPEPVPAPTAAPSPGEPATNGEPRTATPLVRKRAHDAGIDLSTLRGTGPDGVITLHDVEVATATTEATVEATAGAEIAAATSDASAGAAAAPTRMDAGVPSSPYARRLAVERGVQPGDLTGSGPGQAVIARDVPSPTATPPSTAGGPVAAAPAPAEPPTSPPEPPAAATPAPAGPPTSPPTGAAPAPGPEDRGLAMRRAIARAMEQANREIPHYHLGETVDIEDTLRWLSERNADRPPAERVLPAALVLKAVALACARYPDMNGFWVDDGFQPGEGIHLGVAVSLRRGGLLAPAIRDVDRRDLDDLMAALRDLVQRTRSGGLKGSELTDPTITVSNLGDTGVESIHGVITPPQVALVGAGRIVERPWAIERMLAVRRTIFLSLAADHRASDGHRGSQFLAAIADHLRRPETL